MGKNEIRKRMLDRRRQLTENRIEEDSRRAETRFCEMEEFRRADQVFAYMSVNGEIGTRHIIRQAFKDGKEVYLPKVVGKHEMEFYRIFSEADVTEGKFGILEPCSDEMVDWKKEKASVMIVPGVAFDKRGNRIGYGAGFYDRYLEKVLKGSPELLLTALAYEFQIVEYVPSEEFDRKMDRIVTPERCINTFEK